MKKAIAAMMALGLGSSAAAPLAAESKPSIDPQAAKLTIDTARAIVRLDQHQRC